MTILTRAQGSTKTYTLSPLAGGCLLAFLGMIFVAIGVFPEWDTLRFLPDTISTKGTIVTCERVANLKNRTNACYPTVKFQTQEGRYITFNSSIGSDSYVEGETVTVRYHANNPQDARLDPGFIWLSFILFGGLFILGGLLTYLRSQFGKARG